MARIDDAVNAMMDANGAAFTAGFLTSQLKCALEYMPKTKQKMFMAQLERVVGSCVKVKVRNILNPAGGDIELPWDQVGGPCDPSTERYHCM